jgi:isochorismate synthase
VSIIEHLEQALQAEKPCVVYRKPNTKRLMAFFQKTTTLYHTKNYEEAGFVFAPFNREESAVFIPEAEANFISEEYNEVSMPTFEGFVSDENVETRDAHIELVEKTVAAIQLSEIKKIVISRKELLTIDRLSIVEVLKKLLSLYQEAMVYVWYHPKVGLWLGATPETLLKTSGNSFSTMSLAATRPYKASLDVVWNAKELEEQLLVTEFIMAELEGISKSIELAERQTVRAGNVLHLRTLITGELIDSDKALRSLIEALHPTPAVCGLPRKLAKEFILSEEGYDRKYYTGFLGELNLFNTSELFVNLRCMEVIKNTASLYVGGGITAGSNPEKEYNETRLKTETLKKVL